MPAMNSSANAFDRIKPFLRILEGSIERAREQRLEGQKSGRPAPPASVNGNTETTLPQAVRATPQQPKSAGSAGGDARVPYSAPQARPWRPT